MTEVIAREAALEMIQSWAEAMEAEIAASAKLLRAVQSGRLDFNSDTESFRYSLISPVKLENGETIDSLTVTEPTAEQLREANKGNRDEMETTMRALSAVTGKPLAVINRIKTRDITALGEILGFFM
jgi:hypothetical protein